MLNNPASAATPSAKFTTLREALVNSHLIVFLLFCLWLWPFAYGPKAALWPDLFAWTVGLCLCGLMLGRDKNLALAAAVAIVCAATVSSLLGIIQYFELGAAFWPLLVRAEMGKAYGNLRQTNHLATLISVGLWGALWLFPRWLSSKSILCVIGLVLASGMAATASRTGFLQLLLIAFLLVYWRNPDQIKRSYFAGFLGIAYLIAAAVLPWLLKYFYASDFEARVLFNRLWMNQGCSSRVVLWSNILHLISLKPILGWGVGELAYAHYVTLYDGPRFCDKLGNAHNFLLHTAVVLGIPIATCLAAVMSAGFYVLRPWRERDPGCQLAWGILGLLLIHSLLEYPLWFGNFQVLALVCLCIIWLQRPKQLEKLAAFIITRRLLVQVLFTSVTLVIALTAWDYVRISQLYIPAMDRLPIFEDNTLEKVRKSVLFSDEVLFAQVNNAEVEAANAQAVLSGALVVIHSYPEPRIVRKLIEAAHLTGNTELANYHTERFRRAWPEEHLK